LREVCGPGPIYLIPNRQCTRSGAECRWSTRGFVQPNRGIQYEPMDFPSVFARVSAHQRGTPGPSDEVEAPQPTALEDGIDRSRDVPHGNVPSGHRRVLVGRLREFWRSRGATISAQVDEVYVVTAPRLRGNTERPLRV
jgi:hypothetical protein